MPVCKVSDYFGLEFDIAQPLTLPPALLSSAVRLEAISSEMIRSADLAHNEAPAQAADTTGWIGPTAEDIYKQIRVQTPCIDWDEHEHNGIWGNEHDWNRLCVCVEPWSGPVMRGRVFTPGMLHGNWVGHLLVRACCHMVVV